MKPATPMTRLARLLSVKMKRAVLPNGPRLSCGALVKDSSLIYARRQLQALVRQHLPTTITWNSTLHRENGETRTAHLPLPTGHGALGGREIGCRASAPTHARRQRLLSPDPAGQARRAQDGSGRYRRTERYPLTIYILARASPDRS